MSVCGISARIKGRLKSLSGEIMVGNFLARGRRDNSRTREFIEKLCDNAGELAKVLPEKVREGEEKNGTASI